MNYQGTAYNYNQRSEILLPSRTGTTYYSPQNHKPLIAYEGINNDFEFFVSDTNRKPVSLANKTFTARVNNRTTNVAVVTKTLISLDTTDAGSLLLRLSESDMGKLSPALYDITITYTKPDSSVFGLYSDQNARLTYVLEVKENPGSNVVASNEGTSFPAPNYASSPFASTAQTTNSDGTNTVVAYTTNFSGKFYAEATLEIDPAERDWFEIQLNAGDAENYWTFSNATGLEPFTFDGMFMWVRFRFVADAGNQGTLDKVLYRA